MKFFLLFIANLKGEAIHFTLSRLLRFTRNDGKIKYIPIYLFLKSGH